MLAVRNVSYRYGDQAVLADIELSCNAGETVGIVGASGSGKTTLLNLIAGSLVSDRGSIEIDHLPPSEAVRQQRIGYIFQTPALMSWLTVRQNVELPMQLRATRKRSTATAEVDAALAVAHIADAAEKFPHQLSGGMQTRASIARAIVYRPALLLADEPFSALDDLVKESLYRDLQAVAEHTGAAVVLVTHNLSEAALLCDRVYVLGRGRHEFASCILHCEEIALPRPRTPGMMEDQRYLTARRRVREALQ
jgi:NitT/TauT family transport system ATP-binding protein